MSSSKSWAPLYSIADSSLIEEDIEVRYVFLFLLGEMNFYGFFEGSIPSLARRANVSIEVMDRVMKRLQEPDENSRTDIEDGRRIIYQGANKWWVVTAMEHRQTKQADDEYTKVQDRKRKAKQRAKDNGEEWNEEEWFRKDAMKQGHKALEEELKEEEALSEVKPPVKKNPPNVDDVLDWWNRKGYMIERPEVLAQAELFIEYYDGRGWKDNKGKLLTSWRSSATGWALRANPPFPLSTKARFAKEAEAEARAKKVKERPDVPF